MNLLPEPQAAREGEAATSHCQAGASWRKKQDITLYLPPTHHGRHKSTQHLQYRMESCQNTNQPSIHQQAPGDPADARLFPAQLPGAGQGAREWKRSPAIAELSLAPPPCSAEEVQTADTTQPAPGQPAKPRQSQPRMAEKHGTRQSRQGGMTQNQGWGSAGQQPSSVPQPGRQGEGTPVLGAGGREEMQPQHQLKSQRHSQALPCSSTRPLRNRSGASVGQMQAAGRWGCPAPSFKPLVRCEPWGRMARRAPAATAPTPAKSHEIRNTVRKLL